MVGRAERDIEMLEKDLEELRRREEEISQLLQTEDNAHFIQVRWREGEDMQRVRRESTDPWARRRADEKRREATQREGRKQT